MPYYIWVCPVCGDSSEVRRPISEFDRPPKNDVESHASCTEERGHRWVRQMQGGQIVTGLNNKGRH